MVGHVERTNNWVGHQQPQTIESPLTRRTHLKSVKDLKDLFVGVAVFVAVSRERWKSLWWNDQSEWIINWIQFRTRLVYYLPEITNYSTWTFVNFPFGYLPLLQSHKTKSKVAHCALVQCHTNMKNQESAAPRKLSIVRKVLFRFMSGASSLVPIPFSKDKRRTV